MTTKKPAREPPGFQRTRRARATPAGPLRGFERATAAAKCGWTGEASGLPAESSMPLGRYVRMPSLSNVRMSVKSGNILRGDVVDNNLVPACCGDPAFFTSTPAYRKCRGGTEADDVGVNVLPQAPVVAQRLQRGDLPHLVLAAPFHLFPFSIEPCFAMVRVPFILPFTESRLRPQELPWRLASAPSHIHTVPPVAPCPRRNSAAAAANHLVLAFHSLSRRIAWGSSELVIFPSPTALQRQTICPGPTRGDVFCSGPPPPWRHPWGPLPKMVDFLHFQLEVLLEVLLQAGQAERRSQRPRPW